MTMSPALFRRAAALVLERWPSICPCAPGPWELAVKSTPFGEVHFLRMDCVPAQVRFAACLPSATELISRVLMLPPHRNRHSDAPIRDCCPRMRVTRPRCHPKASLLYLCLLTRPLLLISPSRDTCMTCMFSSTPLTKCPRSFSEDTTQVSEEVPTQTCKRRSKFLAPW